MVNLALRQEINLCEGEGVGSCLGSNVFLVRHKGKHLVGCPSLEEGIITFQL